MTPEDEAARRRKANIRLTFVLLASFVVLIYFITVAKMGLRAK